MSSMVRIIGLLLLFAAGAAHAAANSNSEAAAARFIDNLDGTVTDSTTGLTWMRCAMGRQWDGSACNGTAGSYTWAQAKALTSDFGGRSTWRLPNIRELQSIIDWSRFDPAIDTTVFPDTPTSYGSFFWSETLSPATRSGSPIGVGFYRGNVIHISGSVGASVRLVSGGESSALLSVARPNSDYIDHGDGTVMHKPSGLTWKRCSEGQTWTGSTCSGEPNGYGWDKARALSDSLVGNRSWRVPTIEELISLDDYAIANTGAETVINPTVFQGTPRNSYYWSASPAAFDSNRQWGTYNLSGGGNTYSRSMERMMYFVRMVRRVESGSLTVPEAPTIDAAMPGNAEATVHFSAPVSDGGALITSYTVTATPGGVTVTGTSSPIIVSGLKNATAYKFIVTATNRFGIGIASEPSGSVTPAPKSTAICQVDYLDSIAYVTGLASAAACSDRVLDHNVYGAKVTIAPAILRPGTTAVPFSTLEPCDGRGGPPSPGSVQVTPCWLVSPPGVPTGLSASGGDAQVQVSFAAPTSDGGSAITGYTVTSTPIGGIDNQAGTTALVHTITGLANGTAYTFTVTATNAAASGAVSASSNRVTPVGPPGRPTIGAATAGDGSISVRFDAPTNDGGMAITGYTAVCRSQMAGGGGSPITVTGLVNGESYSCTVAATNGAGTGPISEASNSVTPSVPYVMVFVAGWNLVGNGVEAPFTATASFGDKSKVISVWKRVTSGNTPGIAYPAWAFYTPLHADAGAAYAANRGYELLTTINAGEGFWVHAVADFTAPLPSGASVLSASFRPPANPATVGGLRALRSGWSLIATGDRPTPARFDSAIATAGSLPSESGQVATNLLSLLAWDATRANWYFWAPSLVNSGRLENYLNEQGFLDFATLPASPIGTLSPTTGFWVMVP